MAKCAILSFEKKKNREKLKGSMKTSSIKWLLQGYNFCFGQAISLRKLQKVI